MLFDLTGDAELYRLERCVGALPTVAPVHAAMLDHLTGETCMNRRGVLALYMPAMATSLGIPVLARASPASSETHTMTEQMYQRLADRIDIVDTVDLAALAADLRRWDLVRSCFADTVMVDYTSLTGGAPGTIAADAMVAAWRDTLSGFDATQHAVTNHSVTVNGDEAECLSHFRAQHRIGHGTAARLWELDGTYQHTLERSPVGWRIMALTMTWTFERGDRALLAEAATRSR